MREYSIVAEGKPVTLSASWQDLAPELDFGYAGTVCVSVLITANDSTNIQLRALGVLTDHSEPVILPHKDPTTSPIIIMDEFFELKTVPPNYFQAIPFGFDGVMPKIKIQARALVPGATAGTIDKAVITSFELVRN